jgi:hypothetical protein
LILKGIKSLRRIIAPNDKERILVTAEFYCAPAERNTLMKKITEICQEGDQN